MNNKVDKVLILKQKLIGTRNWKNALKVSFLCLRKNNTLNDSAWEGCFCLSGMANREILSRIYVFDIEQSNLTRIHKSTNGVRDR